MVIYKYITTARVCVCARVRVREYSHPSRRPWPSLGPEAGSGEGSRAGRLTGVQGTTRDPRRSGPGARQGVQGSRAVQRLSAAAGGRRDPTLPVSVFRAGGIRFFAVRRTPGPVCRSAQEAGERGGADGGPPRALEIPAKAPGRPQEPRKCLGCGHGSTLPLKSLTAHLWCPYGHAGFGRVWDVLMRWFRAGVGRKTSSSRSRGEERSWTSPLRGLACPARPGIGVVGYHGSAEGRKSLRTQIWGLGDDIAKISGSGTFRGGVEDQNARCGSGAYTARPFHRRSFRCRDVLPFSP